MSEAIQIYNPQPIAQASNDSELIELWLRTKRSPNTRKEYWRDIKKLNDFLIAHYLKAISIRQVKLSDLQNFQDYIIGVSLSANSQRRTLNAVKSLYTFAKKIGYIQFDVAAALTLPKSKNTLAARILSEGDVMKMIALESNPRNQLLIRLLYVSAARVSEAVALRWSDLHSIESAGAVTLYGKGQKTRVVRLPIKLWQDLIASRKTEDDGFIFAGRSFRKRGQSHITIGTALHIVRSAARRAGITLPVTPHWMRHAHASHALQNGASVVLVQETLGHESLQTTSKYSHARPDDSSALHLRIE